MHPDQLELTAADARALVADQFPEWADLPLEPVAVSGSVNRVFRLGERLAVRFPLLPQEPDRVRARLVAEAEASRAFAAASPVAAPEPVAFGEPGRGYPLPWTVQTWLPGRDATRADLSPSRGADDLAHLLSALRRVDTGGRVFQGEGRGGHLPDHDAWMHTCFDRSAGLVDVRELRALWADLRQLPRVDDDVMTHGDLTPPNVLVEAGRLTGLLDTGGFAPADPALDLIAGWHLLDATGRAHVRDVLGCSDVQWHRGMAWTLQQGMGLVWYYAESHPEMARWGRRSLDRLLAAQRT